jgi:hypothetical protein
MSSKEMQSSKINQPVKSNGKSKTKSKSKHTNKKQSTPKSISKGKSFKSLKARITRRSQRKFDVERVGRILDILPQFNKFYNKLSPNEIMAVKYYKGHGSFFQSKLLAEYNNADGKDSKDKKRELLFPFHLWQEQRLRTDIFPNGNDLLPFTKSLDIKELPKYIETSYKARITLLNRLDKIYDRKDCPRMTGSEILFRGMGMNPAIKKLKAGDTYLFKNFISTTIDRGVAEMFSGGECIFIFMNMKDIPFIYMPNSKMYSDDFSKFMMAQEPLNDFSEYTLPRNLEFKIEKIETKPINMERYGMFGMENTNSFAKLQKTLKKQGYFTTNMTNMTNTASALPNEGTPNATTPNSAKVNKNELLEKHLFAKGTFYYCSLHNWNPRTPIQYEEITKNAKFVLDKIALDSWSREVPRFM